MKKSAFFLVIASFILALAAAPALLAQNGSYEVDEAKPALDPEKLKALAPRAIGPAAMSGRVTAFAVDPRNKNIIYAGTASGGLWLSTSQGIGWESVWDDQPAASIGAVAIDPQNSDVIWVATGEGNPRNSQNNGVGLFKTIDGGENWEYVGLENSRHLHRVIVNPRNSDEVYVCSVGPTWSDGEERGVFKTADGGETWDKVLYVDQRTGCGDLVMDPSNPKKLIAAMWEHRRRPWDFVSGGPGSGLYVTHDGGKNWVERTHEDGLPEGDLGRIGLGIAASDPDRVYALVESKKNAFYRSDDGGASFRMMSDSGNIGSRPFYYYDIRVHPTDADHIISIHSSVTHSTDGGRNWENFIGFGEAHPDHHAFYIDPDNPDLMLDGNDGGISITRNGGETWRFVGNLPVGQFYHVRVDMDTPFNVYGGMQDNGSWVGPSTVWQGGFGGGGIRNSEWQMISFGDGFDVVPDPENNRYGYSMSQGGNLVRWDRMTRDNKSIRPPDPDDHLLRFNWNAGIAIDPHDNRTIYYGSQYLHRSRDKGNSWETISPDLTTNDPEKQKQLDSGGLTYDVTGAENFTTIIAIAPSPVKEGVIWVGTDDGNVQVTRNGGDDWSNVADNIPGLAEGAWVPHITASKFKEGGAFVVFDDHRRGNWEPYAYYTEDYGQSWMRLADRDKVRGFVYVLEQDNEVEDLLFLGTEFDLYYSLDGGGEWHSWPHGYPTVPTQDLVVHPRDPALVVGTFGRSIFVVDDITPLREMAREGASLLDEPLHVFPIQDAIAAAWGAPNGELVSADAMFAGEARPRGALVYYVLNKPDGDAEEQGDEEGDGQEEAMQGESQAGRRGGRGGRGGGDEVKVEILNADGDVIRTTSGPAENGLNRTVWGLERKGVRPPGRGRFGGGGGRGGNREPGGPEVLPGQYTVRLSYKGQEAEQSVEVRPDPRVNIPRQDMEAKDALINELLEVAQGLADDFKRLEEAEKTNQRISEVLPNIENKARREGLVKQSKEMGKKIDELKKIFVQEDVQGIRRDPDTLISRYFRASSYINSSWEAPNDNERTALRQLRSNAEDVHSKISGFFEDEWAKFKEAVQDSSPPLFPSERSKEGVRPRN
ncbi:MAG TPA: hypothetical protein VLV83_18290 [Acidobacteriota bacterium]|nr:hypothetical protein [Acidobacteriota bacterium]